MRKLVALGVLGFMLTAAVAAPEAAARRHRGEIHDVGVSGTWPMQYQWEPETVEIADGDRVRWDVGGGHNVTPYDGPWRQLGDPIPPNRRGRVVYRFTEPGTYRYRCNLLLHSILLEPAGIPICVGQCGTVVVGDAQPPIP